MVQKSVILVLFRHFSALPAQKAIEFYGDSAESCLSVEREFGYFLNTSGHFPLLWITLLLRRDCFSVTDFGLKSLFLDDLGTATSGQDLQTPRANQLLLSSLGQFCPELSEVRGFYS